MREDDKTDVALAYAAPPVRAAARDAYMPRRRLVPLSPLSPLSPEYHDRPSFRQQARSQAPCVGRLCDGEARRALKNKLVPPPALAARAAVFAFGDELLVLPDHGFAGRTPGGRDFAAAFLLSRAEAALRPEKQRFADAVN